MIPDDRGGDRGMSQIVIFAISKLALVCGQQPSREELEASLENDIHDGKPPVGIGHQNGISPTLHKTPATVMPAR
jgi:hypothetical protein